MKDKDSDRQELFYIQLHSYHCLLIKVLCLFEVDSCGYPSSPSHASISFSTDSIRNGTVITYTCDIGYELLGPSRRTCNGIKWQPSPMPFCGESLVLSSFLFFTTELSDLVIISLVNNDIIEPIPCESSTCNSQRR